MKIINEIQRPVLPPMQTIRQQKIEQGSQRLIAPSPSIQKAISAYTIIHEAHQLITMAINISFELINRAYSPQPSSSNIYAQLSTINNYFSKLSPSTSNVIPNVDVYTALHESATLINELTSLASSPKQNAIQNIKNKLVANAQILDKTQQSLSLTLGIQQDKEFIDINKILHALKTNEHIHQVFNPINNEGIKRLLT